MCITWPHICFTVHLLWCTIYIVIGSVQLVSGVFFFVSLPILKLGSNIWVGIWNIFFGVGGAVIALIGKWTLRKQRTFLYLAVSVLIANVVNLVILEVGEWHILLPEAAKKLIEQGNLKMLVLYARTITSLSTVVAAVISFVDSQITFCSMQYHEKVYNNKKKEKQDMLSDTEYVLPRVKSDSDDNENASLFTKQYPQSWVYETQTAETSTINSVPNRNSQTSEEPVLDSKQTSSETEFKDISTQNLNIEQPVVVVENTSDYTDRQLHYMATFSRTPSPVAGSDTSSENSCSIQGPAIQECLEKLTEPSVYKSRLDTAISTNTTVTERPPPSMSPRPPSISAQDQLHHDSLMVELQETISNKSEKIIEVAEVVEREDSFDVFKATQKAVPTRQDTVISLERQDTVISLERQDTVISLERQDTVVEVVDETLNAASSPIDAEEDAATNGDGESNYSNNISTDKETIIEFKSDDEVEMPCHEAEEEPPPCIGICDTLDLIEGIQCEPKKRGFITKSSNVCEIDAIFKIAENDDINDDFSASIMRDTSQIMESVLEDSKEEVISSEAKDDSISESASELKDDMILAPQQTEFTLHDEPVQLLKEEESGTSCLQDQDLMEDLIFEPRPSKAESFDSNINNVNKDESDTDREEDKDSVKNIEPISVGSSIDIPPPEIDQLAEGSTDQETDSSDFAIPAPPGEEDEAMNNGVDPDEWDESEDDDSVDSSCVQRVPPTSTTQ